jgi:hypothetical protein
MDESTRLTLSFLPMMLFVVVCSAGESLEWRHPFAVALCAASSFAFALMLASCAHDAIRSKR